MQTLNRISIAFLLAISLFSSCKKENQKSDLPAPVETNLPSIENGRLAFSSHEEFYDFISDLEKDRTGNVTDKIKNYVGFKSLMDELNPINWQIENPEITGSLLDLIGFKFPESYLKILNGEGEVKIGDEIIWYHNNTKYYIPLSDESKIQQLKNNPDLIKKHSPAGSNLSPVNFKNNTDTFSNRTNFAANGYSRDGKWQRQFWQQYPNAGNRKYVHEIETFFDSQSGPGFFVWQAYLTLVIKMEWKGSGSWKPAGELRDITVNISGNAAINIPGQGAYQYGPSISYNASAQSNGEYRVGLARFNGSGTFQSLSWALDLTGTIYQKVVGDVAANAWYNTGTTLSPLW